MSIQSAPSVPELISLMAYAPERPHIARLSYRGLRLTHQPVYGVSVTGHDLLSPCASPIVIYCDNRRRYSPLFSLVKPICCEHYQHCIWISSEPTGAPNSGIVNYVPLVIRLHLAFQLGNRTSNLLYCMERDPHQRVNRMPTEGTPPPPNDGPTT